MSHLVKIEQFLLGKEDSSYITSFYTDDFDCVRLTLHRDILLDVVKQHNVTLDSFESVVQYLSRTEDDKCVVLKNMIPEYVKLLRLLLTIPVSTCTAECSFSALRRLKTYTRATMNQDRLNHVALLNIHPDLARELNLEPLINEFISKTTVRRSIIEAGSTRIEPLKVNVSEASSATTTQCLVGLKLKGIWNKTQATLTAFESVHSFSHHLGISQNVSTTGRINKLKLADPKTNDDDLLIEILIGGDQYWKTVMNTAPIRLSSSIVLLLSIFCWIFSGSRSDIHVHSAMVNFIDLDSKIPTSDYTLRRFWDLEMIGITKEQNRSMSIRELKILHDFHGSYCIDQQRRVVRLPRKDVTFPNNFQNAERCFTSLEKRLERNDSF
ncbi:hypothetical protein ANN_27179 [Periplaneta americana]|uniref:HAT C-terminal dimerisation domain-containing protein n=1 Tax=Periplaneta americana TaxID=6978 RepID=A0ABQ8RXK3_PERAM|nr:hypothetical protein ANN_27179 [Periplaneta americana]